MQARASAQEHHQDRHQEARRDNSTKSSKLDDRYGRIGIPAVAAAVRCKGEQHKAQRTRHLPRESD